MTRYLIDETPLGFAVFEMDGSDTFLIAETDTLARLSGLLSQRLVLMPPSVVGLSLADARPQHGADWTEGNNMMDILKAWKALDRAISVLLVAQPHQMTEAAHALKMAQERLHDAMSKELARVYASTQV